AVVVVRLPVADLDRRATNDRVGRQAPFNRRRVDERLERRAGLPISLRRAVELARVEIVAADLCDDFAGLRIQTVERSLHVGRLREINCEPALILVHRSDLELTDITGL